MGNKKKFDWKFDSVVSVIIALFVTVMYAVLGSVSVMQSVVIFLRGSVAIFALLWAFSFSNKLNRYVEVFIAGFLLPIISNVAYGFSSGLKAFLSLYPRSLFDSVIIGFIALGVYTLYGVFKKK